jgi:hypothetical protein
VTSVLGRFTASKSLKNASTSIGNIGDAVARDVQDFLKAGKDISELSNLSNEQLKERFQLDDSF